MIEKPTVLVLGAGASFDYGFPTGRGLLLNVCEEILDRTKTRRDVRVPATQLQRSLIECGFSLEQMDSFANKLRASNQPSVDEFVADQPDYMDIGKASIASVILVLERERNLNRTSDMRWFEYLFQRMKVGHGPKKFTKNNLSVVTFNYDRSFEMLLWDSITSSYPISNSEHLNLFNIIPIVHVYGSLGSLPFQSKEGISYGSQLDATTVRQCMDNIQIIERGKQTIAQHEVGDELYDAKRICFLGFGYNQTNMSLLRIHRVWRKFVSRQNTIYGTAFGMEDVRIREVKQHIMKGVDHTVDPNVPRRLVIENKKCLEMLSTHPILFELE